MYFWALEIESIEGEIVTLKNGDKISVTDKNKSLFTEEPITGSDLQEKQVKEVATEFLSVLPTDLTKDSESVTSKLIDILVSHNMRLVDISHVWDVVFSHVLKVKSDLDTTIEENNNKAVVNALGKEKLDTFSRVYGATQDAPSNSLRNVRINDIFTN